MKCQSDYDSPDQGTLRQADECIEAWWEPENSPAFKPTEPDGSESTVRNAVAEAVKRGLLKQDDGGQLCLSCAEQEKVD